MVLWEDKPPATASRRRATDYRVETGVAIAACLIAWCEAICLITYVLEARR